MVPIGPDIVQGPWGFWVPAMKIFEATITSRGPLGTNSYYIKAEAPATTYHPLHPLSGPPLCFKSEIRGRNWFTILRFCLDKSEWTDVLEFTLHKQQIWERLWAFIVCV
jgi:hypothetical protein